jgi:hypothetical protein
VSAPERLAALLRGDGGLMASAVAAAVPLDGSRGAAIAAGPRAAGQEEEYAQLVEAIFEGYLQHYGAGRVVRPADPDLALLAGDRLYALGLARLAEIGDLDAITELADVISLAAQAHAEEDPGRADAVWVAGAAAVAYGGGPELEAAKAAARAGEKGAAGALRAAAPVR